MPGYRLRVALTYDKTADAAAALKACRRVLSDHGRDEALTRDGRSLAVLISGGMTEAEASPLADALVSAADTGAKWGKIAAVRTP